MHGRNRQRPGDSAWSKDAFDVRSEPSTQGRRMPRGPRTTPPWAHGELHSSCEIAPPISMSEKILGGKRFTPLLHEAARSNMPYTYQGWTLYSRDVKLKKGP